MVRNQLNRIAGDAHDVSGHKQMFAGSLPPHFSVFLISEEFLQRTLS